MKLIIKIAMLVLAAATLVTLKPSAKADDGKVATVDVQRDANTLIVTVSMDKTEVTSLGVAVTFDEGMQLQSTSWIPEGLMANFDITKNKGVFSTGSSAAAIDGEVFRMVLSAADMEDYHEITVTFIGKNGINTVFDETTTISFGERKIVYGDANGDGAVTEEDAEAIKRYRAGLINETELNLSVCDLNNNGKVDAYDACLIQYYVSGKIDSFPIQNTSSVSN